MHGKLFGHFARGLKFEYTCIVRMSICRTSCFERFFAPYCLRLVYRPTVIKKILDGDIFGDSFATATVGQFAPAQKAIEQNLRH